MWWTWGRRGDAGRRRPPSHARLAVLGCVGACALVCALVWITANARAGDGGDSWRTDRPLALNRQQPPGTKLRILIITECLHNEFTPRHFFLANLAVALARLGHAVRLVPVEMCVVASLATFLRSEGVSVPACPCPHSAPAEQLVPQELVCCGLCGRERLACLMETDATLGAVTGADTPRLESGGADVVLVTHSGGLERSLPRFLAWELLRELELWSPRPKTVLLADDVLSLRTQLFARFSSAMADGAAAVHAAASAPAETASGQVQRQLEVALLSHADATWVVSGVDRDTLRILGVHRVGQVRFLPSAPAYPDDGHPDNGTRRAAFGEREHLLFSGWAMTESSRHGLLFFLKHVLPIIVAQRPDVKLRITGTGWTEIRDRVHSTGFVGPSLLQHVEWRDTVSAEQQERLLLTSRVFVAPVLVQTGVASKVWPALVRGLPVVTTHNGVAGLELGGDKSGHVVSVGRTPAEFARQVLALYTDEELWEAVSEASARHMQRHFSLHSLGLDLERALAQVTGRSAPRPTAFPLWAAALESAAFPRDQAVLCSHERYEGDCAHATRKVSDLSDIGLWEGVSSVALGHDVLLVLYDQTFQRGDCLVVRHSRQSLQAWNGRARSFAVYDSQSFLALGQSVFITRCAGVKQTDPLHAPPPNSCRPYHF